MSPASLVPHCKRDTVVGLSSVCLCVFHVSTFLPPLAPRPLQRFNATMEALTPGRVSSPVQVSLLHVLNLPDHSVPNHLELPCRRFFPCYTVCQRDRSPVSVPYLGDYLVSGLPRQVQASPLASRLTGAPGRNGFVILRTGRSPPVALHPASRRVQLHSVTGCSINLERTFTSLIKYARRRTSRGIHPPEHEHRTNLFPS